MTRPWILPQPTKGHEGAPLQFRRTRPGPQMAMKAFRIAGKRRTLLSRFGRKTVITTSNSCPANSATALGPLARESIPSSRITSTGRSAYRSRCVRRDTANRSPPRTEAGLQPSGLRAELPLADKQHAPLVIPEEGLHLYMNLVTNASKGRKPLLLGASMAAGS